MNLRRWLHEHSLKLLALRDTPEAIAGGVTIGVFFGFMPLFGLKTALALFFAWITRSNMIATIVAATVHDLFIPLMPMIYRWEYQIGYYVLSDPHQWPTKLRHLHPDGWSWRSLHFSWHHFRKFFLGVGKPLCVGGLICSAPFIPLTYFVTRAFMVRHHRRRHHKEEKEKQLLAEQAIRKNDLGKS